MDPPQRERSSRLEAHGVRDPAASGCSRRAPGSSGAGAGSDKCYFYNNSFFVFHDAGMDEFNSAKAAIESNGINVRTDAKVEIWINKTFYK